MTLSRRLFLAAAVMLAPLAAHAAPRAATPEDVTALQAAGKTVLVDFKADWCSTCKAQEKVIGAILADDPALEDKITFVTLDWDAYEKHAFTSALNIPRRSTLVLLRGPDELGRLVAETGRDPIAALIAKGL